MWILKLLIAVSVAQTYTPSAVDGYAFTESQIVPNLTFSGSYRLSMLRWSRNCGRGRQGWQGCQAYQTRRTLWRWRSIRIMFAARLRGMRQWRGDALPKGQCTDIQWKVSGRLKIIWRVLRLLPCARSFCHQDPRRTEFC